MNQSEPGLSKLSLRDIRWLILGGILGVIITVGPNKGWCAVAAGNSMTGVLEEIIVTARRRDEPLMAIPMSMTYLAGADLESLQYRNLDEILSLSPGVLVNMSGDGVSPMITIRGVVSPGELIEPGNSVYVDEVYASGLRTVLPRFYDIQSVQVLKGPQAGLYGKNTLGGAVLITTGQPTDERFARLDASYAQFGNKDVNGTANTPISDSVLLRATAWYNDIDGGYYQSGIVDQNLDASSENGGRLTLAILPNERAMFTLTGEFADTDVPVLSGFAGVVEGAQLGPMPLPPESRRNVLRDDLGHIKQDSARINGKINFDTDVGSFVAVAGRREIKAHDPGSDFDGTAYAASYADFLAEPSNPFATNSPWIYTRDDRDTGLTGELRYLAPDDGGPLRTQIGVSYFEENTQLFNQVAPVRDYALILTDVGEYGSFMRRVDQDSTAWAGFTELIWMPFARVEITTDLRYTRERKDFNYEQSVTGLDSLLNSPDVTLDTSDTFENWSPGITLAYKPDNSLTVFGKYVRGFRAGGFNMLVNNPALLPYDSEEAQNYELGFNALLLEQRLQLGASVFYLRIDNALVPQLDFGELGLAFPLQNAGVAETTGLEVDLAAQITDGLSVTASAGAYTYSLANGGLVGLDRRPYVPDYTAGLVANYEHPLTPVITGIATLGFRHRSGGRVPGSVEIDMDSYHLLDAQLGIRMGKFEFAGFVRNALDDNYVIGNYALADGQKTYVPNLNDTRAIMHDPGAVFGARMTMIF